MAHTYKRQRTTKNTMPRRNSPSYSSNDDEISNEDLTEELKTAMNNLNITDINQVPQMIEASKCSFERNVDLVKSEEQMIEKLDRLILLEDTLTEQTISVDEKSRLEQQLIAGIVELKLVDVDVIGKAMQSSLRADSKHSISMMDLQILQEKIQNLQVVNSSDRNSVQDEIVNCLESIRIQSVNIFEPTIHEIEQRVKKYTRENDGELETLAKLKSLSLLDRININNDSGIIRRKSSQSRVSDAKMIKFYFPSTNITTVYYTRLRLHIQSKYKQLCQWTHNYFPGSHPINMQRHNYTMLKNAPYLVTWKPIGKRYMMFIEKKGSIYLLDNGYYLFQVENIEFPSDETSSRHLQETLLDGEIVIDKVNDFASPCFLINDIIVYNGRDIHQKTFKERLNIISEKIVNMRNKAIGDNILDKSKQPFTVSMKRYFESLELERLMSDDFLRDIPHEVSGFYFIPKNDPYTAGESKNFLKWKERQSILFRLEIILTPRKGVHLYLNKMENPYAIIPWKPALRRYHGKIVECIYDNNEWDIIRARDDRPFANSQKNAASKIHAMNNSVTKAELVALFK